MMGIDVRECGIRLKLQLASSDNDGQWHYLLRMWDIAPAICFAKQVSDDVF